MGTVANINDVLEGRVALEIECVGRLYLVKLAHIANLESPHSGRRRSGPSVDGLPSRG